MIQLWPCWSCWLTWLIGSGNTFSLLKIRSHWIQKRSQRCSQTTLGWTRLILNGFRKFKDWLWSLWSIFNWGVKRFIIPKTRVNHWIAIYNIDTMYSLKFRIWLSPRYLNILFKNRIFELKEIFHVHTIQCLIQNKRYIKLHQSWHSSTIVSAFLC